MKWLSWNCWGLGSPRTIRERDELLQAHDPDFVFFIKTWLSHHRVDFLRRVRSFDGISISASNGGGGLSFWWRRDMKVSLCKYNSSFVDILWTPEEGGNLIYLTGFYGEASHQRRHPSWESLASVGHTRSCSGVVAGDFNEILSHKEKRAVLGVVKD